MVLKPLALSLGDPAGVGPELIAEAWARRDEEGLPPFFVAGGAELLVEAAASRGIILPIQCIGDVSQAGHAFAAALPVIGESYHAWSPGMPDRAGAEFAVASLREATRLAFEGQAAGLVTGPVAKSRLAEIGFDFPGQTEFLAHACGVAAEAAVMMLAGPRLRAVPLTVHVALAMVPAMLTTKLIIDKARIVAAALVGDFGIDEPCLAIAGLNPHAGEQGQMGDEETRIIAPAIAALRAEGIDASGPHPADSLFTTQSRADYDVALCMYHDQALIPTKTLDFDQSVNVTLGLPIVRTSPDHGTAFALAGKGEARADALIAAIRMAGECAARRAEA